MTDEERRERIATLVREEAALMRRLHDLMEEKHDINNKLTVLGGRIAFLRNGEDDIVDE